MSNKPMVWEYNGHSLFFNPETEMGCLTSFWEACGRPPNKRPVDWLNGAWANEVIGSLTKKYKVEISHLIFIRRGRGDIGGGTWACWQLTLAYAHYLNADLYLTCIEEWRAYKEGQFAQTPESIDLVLERFVGEKRELEQYNGRLAYLGQQIRVLLRQEPATAYAEPKVSEDIRNSPALDPKHSGYVYVYKFVYKDIPLYKVGQTKGDIETRKNQAKGQMPIKLEEIDTLKSIQTTNCQRLEKKIHKFYEGFKYTGEWFRLSDEQLQLLLDLPHIIDARLFEAEKHLALYEHEQAAMALIA